MTEGMAQAPGYDPAALDDEGVGTVETGLRVPVIPDGLYPIDVGVRDYFSSTEAGTPGIELIATVNEGPWKGHEFRPRDSRIWLTPGKMIDDGMGGLKEKSAFNNLGKVRHQIAAVTGKKPHAQAFIDFGFPLQGLEGKPEELRLAIKTHFASMSVEQRKDFMASYARVNEWAGKSCVAAMGIASEKGRNPDRSPKLDDDGNQIIYESNSIQNLFAYGHPENGLAAAQRQFTKQADEKKQMEG